MACWRGTSDKLVVVLSGVGQNPDEYPPFEFFKSATEDQKNHALFISDKSRSWLNGDGLSAQIIDRIGAFAKELGTSDIHLLGNSMGGTMALLLKDLVGAKTVLAFVPQYSVSPDVIPEEKRWKKYRKNIKTYDFPEVRLRRTDGQTVFIVHGDTPGELLHAQKFPQFHGLRHYIVQDQGHNLSRKLKRKQQLSDIISAAINDRPYKFRRLMRRNGAIFRQDFDADHLVQPSSSIAADALLSAVARK
ncbi:hypothetical protein [Sulfitobacter sp. MF3-043]|uniref:hypothetical protein n=1 Tax=Sulfitobacter sediminivivens TaxID=3252902 RepID=UPI0036D9BC77